MIKRRIALIAAIAGATLALSSCNLSKWLNSTTSTSILNYSITDAKHQTALNKINSLIELADTIEKNGMSTAYQYTIVNYLNSTVSYISELASARNKEYVSYCLDKSRTTAKYQNLQEKFTEIYQKYQEFMKVSAETTELRSYIFGNKTDEEIENIIGKQYSDRYYELNDEISQLDNSYRSLSSKDENFSTEAEAIYVNIINKSKELAKEAGYNSFLEFKYSSFNRDYTEEDSDNFFTYVKDYMLPELYDNQYKASDLQVGLTEDEKTTFKSMFSSHSKSSNMDLFDSYMNTFTDSTIKSNYTKFKNLYSFYADTTNSYDGAYTTYILDSKVAVCYFGYNYQDIFTKVHEFGHMNSMTLELKNSKGTASLDVSETQSQSNEMLFLAYLENNNSLSSNVKEAIRKYRIRSALTTIVLSTIMDQFEQRIYDNNASYDASELNDVMISLCDEMGGYQMVKDALGGNDPVEYYHRAIISSRFYYISYATSLIPSINLYEEAKNDYSNALNIYKTIYNFDTKNYNFKDGMVNAGLSNPFTEEAFIGLANLLS